MPYKLRIYARSDTLSVENTRDFDLNFTNQPFLEIARASAASERAEEARDEAQAARDTTLGYRDDADQSATVATNRASEATSARDTTLGYRDDSETFASNASASATSASKSESNAAGSASEAAGSAQDASDSEGNAADSATNAANSATAAATSESNAANSATDAATSETNAANSATDAATSETNAAQSATDAQDAVDTIDEPTIVRDFGDQTIGGVKTFSDGVEADSYGGDGVTQSFDDNTEGRLVRVQDGDGRYMLALPARRQINMLERFEPGDASFDALGNIEIAAPDGTGAVGLYGGAISFARPDGSSRRRAAIAAVQTRASENQVGLAFFTSGGTATSTNNISLRAMLRDTGSFYLAKSDYYANWNQSYDDPQGDLVYHTANLVGTVSQSGGTPTGAVIERGSNSNGEYVRFADGTQICTNDDVANVSVEDESGNWWRSPLFTWDFPVSFSSRPFVYGGVGGTSGADCNRVVGTFGQSSATQATLRVFTASGSASNQSRIGACAVGRWF